MHLEILEVKAVKMWKNTPAKRKFYPAAVPLHKLGNWAAGG